MVPMEKFVLPTYKAPDFEALGLADAPDAKLVEAQQDGVAPSGIFPHSWGMAACAGQPDGLCRRAARRQA